MAKKTVIIRLGNPSKSGRVTIRVPAKTRKAAVTRARALRKKLRTKNVEMGFYDGTGFHPIRASKDYSSAEVKHGSEGRKARSKRARRSGALYSTHY